MLKNNEKLREDRTGTFESSPSASTFDIRDCQSRGNFYQPIEPKAGLKKPTETLITPYISKTEFNNIYHTFFREVPVNITRVVISTI